MARITVKDFTTSLGITQTYDIVNAIRNSASDNFQRYVPLANDSNVLEVGQGILINQQLQNEFITSLVERIGLVVIRNVSLNNHLKKFKKGLMPQGRTIEEIFVDITNEKKYDAEDAEQTVFKRTIPNVKTLFHERNRQGYYEQTIQDDSLKSAFTSWGNFESFISRIISAIYNSAEVDEYRYMMLLADNYYAKGLFKVEKVTKPDNETTAREFVKKVRSTATKMTLPFGSRDYNALAVHTRSDMNDLHLLISAELEATLDVDVLAKAFNMDKTTFLGHVTVIDGFASEGLEAILVDKDWYMVYDTLQKMETIRNPKGLYWNYFYHVWQVLSVSRFANAVAFVSGEVAPVTQVIIDPTIASIKQGRTHQFNAFVRQTDNEVYTPVWTVVATGTTTKLSGTKIVDGLLTLDANQTGELKVIATVTYDTDKTVQGESIVTVIPNN